MNKEQFLDGLEGQNNHRVLLWEGLKLMTGETIIEMGSGEGSTPYFQKMAGVLHKIFISYENNADWAKKTGANFINNWDEIFVPEKCFLFIDHAPGERRKKDIVKYKDLAEIIVIHDTQIEADHGYQMRQHFNLFKWGVEMNTPGGGAGSVMVSNHIDLSSLVGLKWDKYLITEIKKQ